MTSPSTQQWQLGVRARPWRLGRALLRAGSPFVMVHLLAFRERASGAFEGLSGREAYERYARSAAPALASIGSKRLWGGEVAPVEDGWPSFELAALLQHPSPRSFLRFALHGGADSAARRAALRGQWLLAAQTADSAPWEVAHRDAFIELVGCGEGGERWEAARREARTSLDGELVWRGRVIERVIGEGPCIDEVLVTAFTDQTARAAGRELLSLVAREAGVDRWWTYMAQGTETLPEPLA